MIAIAALVGVAFLLGFSPEAGLTDWLAVGGVVVLLAFAAGWFTVALGLSAKSPDTTDAAVVVAWRVAIALAGYLWARSAFTKRA
ncbi:hypothetical protein O7631_08270 [Micromonospora sp. WMMD967]|uniref:hypothetical protein n=1 Tax=Micromonospora sp. WMMD967 TaxID=3016101 RepID=UPI002416389C|nr:hypothetical protein [Micromonospora sp. WMMD967]MDG4836511.1 hypothetical protein [Micromonospora sp. WMMD967]